MRTIKTYSKRAPFYNAFTRRWSGKCWTNSRDGRMGFVFEIDRKFV